MALGRLAVLDGNALSHGFADHFPQMLRRVELKREVLSEILDDADSGVPQAVVLLVVLEDDLRLLQIVDAIEDRVLQLPKGAEQLNLICAAFIYKARFNPFYIMELKRFRGFLRRQEIIFCKSST